MLRVKIDTLKARIEAQSDTFWYAPHQKSTLYYFFRGALGSIAKYIGKVKEVNNFPISVRTIIKKIKNAHDTKIKK